MWFLHKPRKKHPYKEFICLSHHRFVVLQHDDKGGILGELPPPSIFSKRPQSYTQPRVYHCVTCGDSISSESNQRGIKRTKCDSCKKERDRLVNMMYYWMNKVGIRFDIEEDFEDEEDDDIKEFN